MISLLRHESSETQQERAEIQAEVIRCTPAEWANENITVSGNPLNLNWRPWWFLPYNMHYMRNNEGRYRRRSVMMCGRGTEKCVFVDSAVSLLGGEEKRAENVSVGDTLVSIESTVTRAISFGKVTWVSEKVAKPCLKITTRSGKTTIVSTTHPMRRGAFWVEAERLRVSEPLLTVHNGELVLDRISHIEDVGEKRCVDFTVSPFHNFVIDGFVTHNSTNLGNMALTEIQVPQTRILYIAPSREQLSEFSFHRIDEIVETSPVLNSMKRKDQWSVGRKVFHNYSRISLRSAYLTAARARGIHVHILYIDEAQDIVMENIPVIRECLAHCDRPEGDTFRLLGTPLTFDNPLEYYWAEMSNQMEWMVRCDSCGKWNEGMFEPNIGKYGLVCDKCGSLLNPFGKIDNDGSRSGAGWVAVGRTTAPLLGFHIPQLLLPYTFAYHKELFRTQWLSLLDKYENYERYRFANEVLGISYDSGEKPITRQELIDCCTPGHELYVLDRDDARTNIPPKYVGGQVFCGVDWGSGDPSKTVFTAARYNGDVFEVFYMKKFLGRESDPEYALEYVLWLLRKVQANYVGLDWGFGFGLNSRVAETFGRKNTVVYSHSSQRAKLNFDISANAMITNRTAVLSDIFYLIKRGRNPGGISFKCAWEHFRDGGFAKDFLSTHKEVAQGGMKMVYQHPPGTTDDTLHSVCYAFLVSQLKFPRRDLI